MNMYPRWVALPESTGSNRRFPAPTGSATEPTGILIIFAEGCFLFRVVSHKNNQETHRESSARDFLKITESFYQHCNLVQHGAFACVTIYLRRS